MNSREVNGRAGWSWVALALAVLLPLAALAGPVNVNTADAATLARELQGIGSAKAAAIVAHRDKHGPFRSVDDLARVKGIGRKTLDRNREFIRLDARGAPATRSGAPAPSAAGTAGRAAASPAPSLPRTRPGASPPGSPAQSGSGSR